MKIEEAILYVLAERGGGLRTEQIADIINRRKLHVRKDGRPGECHEGRAFCRISPLST